MPLTQYATPDLRRAVLQLANTFGPYIALWFLLIFAMHYRPPVVVILALIFVASLFLVRIFMLLHDCAHGSFFASHRANTILGYVAGILVFTPFTYWKHNHLVHHGTYADLEHRGIGDIWTLTVDEYLAASPAKRLGYRLYRNPIIFLGLGPGYLFLISQRLTHHWDGQNERLSVALTNLAIVLILFLASLSIGVWTYVLIQIPIILITGIIGVWLFYVQHQFDGVYWAHHENWDPAQAALRGSSHYSLPGILRWFSGNIGIHHLHHIMPKVPNYRLQECYNSSVIMQAVPVLTIRRSLKSFGLNLWDEKQQKLVSFRSLKNPAAKSTLHC